MSWFQKKNDYKYYADKVIKLSYDGASIIKTYCDDPESDFNKVGDKEFSLINFEFIYFFLHLIDRLAFNSDIKNRGEIMSALEEQTISTIINVLCEKRFDPQKIEQIKTERFNIFHNSVKEYSQYQKWFPDKDEGMKDTLFWEFAKNICELSGNKDDIAVNLMATKYVSESLPELMFIKSLRV